MTLRAAVIATHRWLGVAAAAFWLLQALTGVLIVFHWEIDDALARGAHVATDFHAIETKLRSFEPHSMWTSAGFADRWDVFLDDRTLRIDGAGNILRVQRGDGVVGTIVVLHQTFLLARWLTGTSGALLISNILLGVIAAWPRRGQWGRALRPLPSGARVARLYSWHRAIGLWLAIFALLSVSAGVLLAFDVGYEQQSPTISGAPHIGMTRAVEIALARYPGAAVSGIGFPTNDNAMWTLTIKQRGELRRAYGKTRIFISAVDGRVAGEYNALTASPAHKFVDYLFSFHTGEMAGLFGRLVVMVTGIWLVIEIGFGLTLWWTRRQLNARSRMSASSAAPRPS